MAKKYFKPADIKFIRMQSEAGKTHRQIAADMTAEGYVTNRDNPITENFINSTLYRHRLKAIQIETPKEDKFADIKELMKSNLPDRLKDRFLPMLLEL